MPKTLRVWNEYIFTSSLHPLVKILLSPIGIVPLLTILIVTWVFDWWMPTIIGLTVLGFLGYGGWLVFRKVRADPARPSVDDEIEESPLLAEDTRDLDLSDLIPQGKRIKPRQILVDNEGNKYLAVHQRTTYRKHLWSKPQRSLESYICKLNDGPFVDTDFALKTTFVPIDSEKLVHIFTRLHWWSRGPKQIGLVLLAILTSAVLLWAAWSYRLDEPAYDYALAVVFVLQLTGYSFTYFVVWMHWAYEYLVVTDERVLLIYAPPFWLVGYERQVFLKDILSASMEDQSAFGNFLPDIGITGFGIVKGDTASNIGDEWYNQGIRYVRFPRQVARIITAARADAHRRGQINTASDVELELQQRLVAATEELVRLQHEANATQPKHRS